MRCAGPGSPEWHDAVARVNAGETGTDNEYAILVKARENLASGKAYREVRPGIGFTRKVLASIEKDSAASAARKSPLSANLISYLGAGLFVATLALIMVWVIQGSGGPVQPEDLTGMFFSRPVLSATFDRPLMPGWRIIGPLTVDPAKGLAPTVKKSSADYIGGGVVSSAARRPPNLFRWRQSSSFSM